MGRNFNPANPNYGCVGNSIIQLGLDVIWVGCVLHSHRLMFKSLMFKRQHAQGREYKTLVLIIWICIALQNEKLSQDLINFYGFYSYLFVSWLSLHLHDILNISHKEPIIISKEISLPKPRFAVFFLVRGRIDM